MDKNPPCAMRGNSPCKDCTEKFTVCHAGCPKDKRGEYGYEAWKAELKKVQKNRAKYNEENWRREWELKNS